MNFRARAKTPGECCWATCTKPADKIYVDDEYKYLACCKAHAEIVAVRIPTLPEAAQLYLKTPKKDRPVILNQYS